MFIPVRVVSKKVKEKREKLLQIVSMQRMQLHGES